MQIFEHKNHWLHIGILFFLSVTLYFTFNNKLSLTHPDEVFYIQTAKEMISHNSYMTPMIFDEPQFEKPILSYWLFVFAIKSFGLTPFAGRFFPAFFGVVGVLFLYWLGYLIFRKKSVAFLSALILSTSLIYVAMSRAVLTDMIFSVIVLISISFFYWAIHYEKYRQRGIVLGFIFSGLAVLTKGVLGAIFPWLTVLIYLGLTKQLKLIKNVSVVIGLVLFGLIAIPWHVQMYNLYGQEFIKEYWNNVHVRRILEAEHRRLDNAYFYPVLMIFGFFPWFVLWPVAVLNIIDHWKKNTIEKKGILFLLTWIGVVYLVMQSAHSKLASYILPLFPAAALLLGFGLEQALQKTSSNIAKALKAGTGLIGIIFLAMSIGAVVAGYMYKGFIGNIYLAYAASMFLLLLAIMAFLFFMKDQLEKMVFIFPTFTAILLFLMFWGCPIAEPWVSCRQVSESFSNIDNSDSVVLTSKFFVRGIRYYTDRKMAVIDLNGAGFFSPHPIPFLTTDKGVVDLLNSQPVTYAIVKEGNVHDLERIVAQNKGFKLENLSGSGGKYILRIEKLSQEIRI